MTFEFVVVFQDYKVVIYTMRLRSELIKSSVAVPPSRALQTPLSSLIVLDPTKAK